MRGAKASEEAARLLAERSPNASLMKEGPPGSDLKYIELALIAKDMETMSTVDDKFNNVPLHLAVLRGQIDLARQLIAAGVYIDPVNVIQFTPLHFAVHAKALNLEFVRELLIAGAEPNKKDIDGNSCLHYACKNGLNELVDLLLQHGAEVNIRDSKGRTPLYIAIEHGHGKIAKRLIANYHADPTIRTYKGRTLYHAAAMSSGKQLLQTLIPINNKLRTQQNAVDIFGRNPEFYTNPDQFIDTSQSIIVEKYQHYLELRGRNKELFSENGYCNGFTLLAHFYDSLQQHELYQHILEAFAVWDGTVDSLKSPLSTPLAGCHTLDDLFEGFFDSLALVQQIREISFSLLQEDRNIQLAFLGRSEGFHQILHRFSNDSITLAQLEEMLELLQSLPGNVRFDLGGARHVVAFKVNSQHQFDYSDSNFESSEWVHANNAKALVDIIANTKYLELKQEPGKDQHGNMTLNDVRLVGYYFDRDNVSMASFNYFSPATLPKTKSEVEAYIAHSPSGFSQFHVVVLTNSLENFTELLAKDFFWEYMHVNCAAFWNEARSPLDMLFANRNSAMLEILFAKIQHMTPDIQDELNSRLSFALAAAWSKMRKSTEIEDTEFFKVMIKYLDETRQMQILKSIIEINDLPFLNYLLSQNVFDKITKKSMRNLSNDPYISEKIKMVMANHIHLQQYREQTANDIPNEEKPYSPKY